MLVYCIVLSISIFFAFLYQKCREKHIQRRICAVASAIPLTIVSALRFDVGTDYFYAYLKTYYCGEVDSTWMGSPAFPVLYKIMKMLSAHYQWIFFISSVFISIFVFTAVYQQSSNPALSIFLYVTSTYYFIGMNAVRQFCAMSVCLYGMKYLSEKKGDWKYIICVIIGAMFHTTAIVMLIMVIVKLIPVNRVSILLYGVLLIATYFSLPTVVKLIAKIPYYGGYIGSGFDEKEFETMWFLISLIVVVFSLIFYKLIWNLKLANVHIKSMLISLGILAFSASIPLTKRIAWYFAFSQIILIPIVIQKIERQNLYRFFKTCIVCFYAAMCFLGIGYLNAHECLPYQMFFSHSAEMVAAECEERYGKKDDGNFGIMFGASLGALK